MLATSAGSNVPQWALPADASVFRFPRSLTWIMFGCFLISLGFVALTILTRPARGSLAIGIACTLLFGSGAALSLRSFHRFRDSVAVNSDGVWYLPRKRESTFIAWSDVASVRVDDIQQRLVLADATGNRKIRLEYQLENFGQLRDFVLHHTAAIRLCSPRLNVFHRTWINKGILLACAVPFLIFARLSHSPSGRTTSTT